MATLQSLADRLLTDLGAPHTPDMQAAAQAWIAHENGVNNNILGVTSGGKLNSYSTPEAGIDAAAALLQSPSMLWAGYDKIVYQAQQGNSTGFLSAISFSKWNGPGGAYRDKPNVLLQTFHNILSGTYPFHGLNSPGTSSDNTPLPNPASSSGINVVGSESGGMLSGFGFGITLPVGHIITQSDIDNILKALEKQGQFSGDPTGVSEGFVRDILQSPAFKGQAWTKDLQISLQEKFGQVAGTNPLTSGIGNLFPDVQSAVIFLAVVLIGIVFIGGGAIITLRKNV